MTKIMQDILKLSIPERILMVEAIWNSIAENDDEIELNADTKQLLDKRLEAHKNSLNEGSSWDEVKATIKKQL